MVDLAAITADLSAVSSIAIILVSKIAVLISLALPELKTTNTAPRMMAIELTALRSAVIAARSTIVPQCLLDG